MSEIGYWCETVHALAVRKGWWPTRGAVDVFAEKIALIHSEASEALEEFRNGHEIGEIYMETGGKPCGVPIELADIVIRVMDLCEEAGINLESAIQTKHWYNEKRPKRHGGKRI